MSMHIGSALSPGRRTHRQPSATRPAQPWSADVPRAARAGCAVLLLVTSPVMVLAAVAVLATSAGPTLTRSARIGPDGRVVVLRQFRTTYRPAGGHGALPDPGGITPVGRVLRWSRIARLPMLADVWQGKIGLAAALRA